LIKYGNGDTYKGGVLQNMKTEESQDGMYTYANGDTYEGSFKQDKKEGAGKLLIAA
jgi:hypothetical protein